MKLDLPDDHPIAKVIRDLTREGWPSGQLMLSLDHFSPAGIKRVFTLEIDAWTATAHTEKRFELNLADAYEHHQQIKAMMQWPEPCIDTD